MEYRINNLIIDKMTTNTIYLVYKNAHELLLCRGAKEVEEPRFKDESSLISHMQSNNNYVVVNAQDMQVIVFADKSEATKSTGLEKIFKNVVKKYTIFILPSTKELSSLTVILSKNAKKEYSKPSQLFEAGISCNWRLEVNVHASMIFNMRLHISTARYELVPPEEVTKWCKTVQRNISSLPKIPFNDPTLFWYGGFKEGDVVKEIYNSPTAGEACEMKLVINGYIIKISKTKKQTME
jgi:DNA-directed RNA polymerase subunit H (RpoH/RPB5)